MDVDRFLEAQAGGVYEQALAELRAGCKRTHWIWFIFPQVKGLGRSHMADYYGIGSRTELGAYAANQTLMSRLTTCAQALLDTGETDPERVLGSIDALKVRSSMTLFELVSSNPVFAQVLDQFYHGVRDRRTLDIVAQWG